MAAAALKLSNDEPPAFVGVSYSQLSIARHYGGVKVGRHRYTYFPEFDELVRDDVVKMVAGMRRAARREAEADAMARQGSLL
jgi:hypothetical protein